MSICIYTYKNYKILKINNNSFIIININKEFKNGHTHVNNYYIAKSIIYACIHGYLPKKCSHLLNNKRILKSIIRVCSNKYLNRFENVLQKINRDEE